MVSKFEKGDILALKNRENYSLRTYSITFVRYDYDSGLIVCDVEYLARDIPKCRMSLVADDFKLAEFTKHPLWKKMNEV